MTITRGPWRAEKTIKGWYVRRERGTVGDSAIAKVLKVPGTGSLLDRDAEAAANAAAIAALPELIAFATMIVGEADYSLSKPGFVARIDRWERSARAVLAKLEEGSR